LPDRRYRGHHKATEEEPKGDQGILEKRSGERKFNVDSRIQVELEEDGGSRT